MTSKPLFRRQLIVAVIATALAQTPQVLASDVRVPTSVQIPLIVKIAGYDRHFLSHAGSRVQVLVLGKTGSIESNRAAKQASYALAQLDEVGGRPHDDFVEFYSHPQALADLCKAHSISLLIVTPGLSDDIEDISKALTGMPILTASLVGEDVPKGVVIGIDLVSGKPKLLCSLVEARKHDVSIEPQLLNLMKVYE